MAKWQMTQPLKFCYSTFYQNLTKIIIKNMTGGRFNECHLIQAAADDDDVKKQQLE